MSKQEKSVLLSAFELMTKTDRIFLLKLAQALRDNHAANTRGKSTKGAARHESAD